MFKTSCFQWYMYLQSKQGSEMCACCSLFIISFVVHNIAAQNKIRVRGGGEGKGKHGIFAFPCTTVDASEKK